MSEFEKVQVEQLFNFCPNKYHDINLFGECLERLADGIATAVLGRLEATHDVLQSGCHKEVLLLQTQLLALEELQYIDDVKHERNEMRMKKS